MPGEPLPVLPRFPCLCQAIYSWSGETKRDLGFVEGDLIECLNAGDGSWWMGRLKRNRQMGLFPSNFVQVLEDTISPSRPVSRNGASSPRFGSGGSILRAASPAPTHYSRAASPAPTHYSRAASPAPTHYSRIASPAPTHYSRAPSPQMPAHYYLDDQRGHSPIPYQHDDRRSRSPVPYQQGYNSRSNSPNPYPRGGSPNPYIRGASPAPSISRREYMPREASPAPPAHYSARAPSPAASMMQYHHSTPPNPYIDHDDPDISAPPAPPPHRCQRASSPSLPLDGRRTPAPNGAHSPAILGNTPSPLRNAMEDVMESLQHMTARDDNRTKTPVELWPPEAFVQQYHSSPSARKSYVRPETSLGIGDRNEGYPDDDENIMTMYPNNQRTNFNNHKRFRSDEDDLPPPPPPKNTAYDSYRPQTGDPMSTSNRKSMYDIGRRSPGPNKLIRPRPLSRTTTIKSSATSNQSSSTNATVSTALTSASLMSGMSAGACSATSAGSLARRKEKAISVIGGSGISAQKQVFAGYVRSETPTLGSGSGSGLSSGGVGPGMLRRGQTWASETSGGGLGGLAPPKPGPKAKKPGFLKKILNSAKTSTASARGLASGTSSPAPITTQRAIPDGIGPVSGRRAMQLQSQDWVQVRRDVNRSNTLSRNERIERQEKQQLMDQIVLRPVDALDDDVDGDEGADGRPVENPVDFDTANLALVDKGTRFIGNLPPLTTPESLATHHVCRPYRSDLQRLRAIFTWVSEKIAWEHPSGPLGNPGQGGADPRSVIQQRRGGPAEVAEVVMGMCTAIGIHCEIVAGYLKVPGEALDVEMCPRPNHWWNGVIVDGEWRFMDCSLASPTNPRRVMYSSASTSQAELFYFLTKPSHLCWTHIPQRAEQQHLVPPLPMAILLALPSACPPFFKHNLQMNNFDTSLTRIENLEVAQIEFTVPIDVECIAEVEVRGFAVDQGGDLFESGNVIKKRALCQVAWENGVKTYRVKAVLPGDEGHGVLKIYAGHRGLIHSMRDNPHPLAFALPIIHTGENPPYDFLVRHPTPHAQRHDLYVSQPQCARLAVNNTFVFAVRQHPSEGLTSDSLNNGPKPAKLAIQTPAGKILRLMKKADTAGAENGMIWETIIKCGERGAWRALVLADRSARWCVYAEWTVV